MTTTLENLTPREREILFQLALCKSNKEIAKTLVIEEKSVENHLSNIYSKLNVRNRTMAVVFYMVHLIMSDETSVSLLL